MNEQEQLKAISDRLQKEQEYDRYYHSKQTILQLLEGILEHKRTRVVMALQQVRSFQEDVLAFLRAFELMLETVAGASTHAEKAARLRGLMELVSTAATRVRERQFKDSEHISYFLADDVFRCDFPVRHWMQKAREAEARATAAEEERDRIRESCKSEVSEQPPGIVNDEDEQPF